MAVVTLTGTAGPAHLSTQFTVSGSSGGRKAPLAGLVDRNTVPASNLVPYSVIQPKWSDLEPQQGTYDFTTLDHMVAQAKAAGVIGCRLRPVINSSPPNWAAARYGMVTVQDVQNPADHPSYVRYWNAQDDFALLDAALAAHCDNDPFFLEYALTFCATVYEGEIFVRQASIKANITAMLAATFDPVRDVQQLLAWPAVMASHWKNTPCGAFNTKPYQHIQSDGTQKPDFTVNQAFFNSPGIAWGGVNNADQASYVAPLDPETYGFMHSLKSSSFQWGDQTVTMGRMGSAANLVTCLAKGAAAGVTSLELPASYQQNLTAAQMQTANAAYRA